jgi:hypothetical protein
VNLAGGDQVCAGKGFFNFCPVFSDIPGIIAETEGNITGVPWLGADPAATAENPMEKQG